MMKPITGQYECVHRSGLGLDYFTSRIDRLTLFPNGRFAFILQDRSRAINAAQSFMNGQQVSNAAPETRREGQYMQQGNAITFSFDDGKQEQGQLSWNGDGVQIGGDFFNKVSDSTMLPPPQRLKKDMDDIAKGLKIADTIGGIALQAAKGIHNTIQSTQPQDQTQQGQPASQGPASPQPMQAAPSTPAPAQPTQSRPPIPVPPAQPTPTPQPGYIGPVFCDQCGIRARPGKRFCSNCGAQLP
jgi:hypothetical protein